MKNRESVAAPISAWQLAVLPQQHVALCQHSASPPNAPDKNPIGQVHHLQIQDKEVCWFRRDWIMALSAPEECANTLAGIG